MHAHIEGFAQLLANRVSILTVGSFQPAELDWTGKSHSRQQHEIQVRDTLAPLLLTEVNPLMYALCSMQHTCGLRTQIVHQYLIYVHTHNYVHAMHMHTHMYTHTHTGTHACMHARIQF